MNVWQNWFNVAWKAYTEKDCVLANRQERGHPQEPDPREMRISALENDVNELQLNLAKLARIVYDLEDHTLTSLEGFLTQIEKLQECERPIAIATARSREPKPHTRSHHKTLRLSPAAAIRRAKRK